VVRFAVDFRVVRFLGRRAAVVRLRVVRFRAVPLRFRAAAPFLPARDLAADLRFRVAAPFRAAVDRFREVVFRLAVVFLLAVDFFRPAVFFRAVAFFLRAGAMRHLLPALRTPCASGVVVPVHSCLPTRRSARRGAGRS
jgi:hypothetical protein